MKKVIIFIISLFVFISCSRSHKLMVKATYTQPYCGGARPTPEVLAEAEKVHNYANRMVIVVNTMGGVDSAMTDTAGYITKKFRLGYYKLYEPWRYYKRSPNGEELSELDTECISKEWTKPFATVSIMKRMVSVNIEKPIELYCPQNFPCAKNKVLIPVREQK